jgi:hypothetical protein
MKLSILSFLILCVLISILTIVQAINCGAHGKVGSVIVGNNTLSVFCICDEGYIGSRRFTKNCCNISQNQTLQYVASYVLPCDTPYDWKSGENVSSLALPCIDDSGPCPSEDIITCPSSLHVGSATS